MSIAQQAAEQMASNEACPAGEEDAHAVDSRLMRELRRYYEALLRHYGPQQWWPAKTRFEVILGAILVQNTAWRNVEKALANLRAARALNVSGMRRLSRSQLEALVRPSGFFRQKAERLKDFISYLDSEHRGSLARMFLRNTEELRSQLLALKGIGRETADSILLYAAHRPVFVVDAYARRVLARHELIDVDSPYEKVRGAVESAIRRAGETDAQTAQHFNELHALFVAVGKGHCRSVPLCAGCPLQRFLPATGPKPLLGRVKKSKAGRRSVPPGKAH